MSNSMLIAFSFQQAAIAATTAVIEFTTPHAFTLVGASFTPIAFTGTPTNASVAVNDDGTAAIAAASLTSTTAGTPALWTSTHLGGTAAPVYVADGSNMTVDLAFSGGTSPTASFTLMLWALVGE